MKYMELQRQAADLGYRTELDRIKVEGHYAQKNRVHIFDEQHPASVAKIFEFDAEPQMDSGLPSALVKLINQFAQTPLAQRGIQDCMPADANIRR